MRTKPTIRLSGARPATSTSECVRVGTTYYQLIIKTFPFLRANQAQMLMNPKQIYAAVKTAVVASIVLPAVDQNSTLSCPARITAM